MMTVAEAELVRRAQEKGRSASFCAPAQHTAALAKAHSSQDLLQQMADGGSAAQCLSVSAQYTGSPGGTPQRLKVAGSASKRSQSCRVAGSSRPPRVKRRDSSTKDLNVINTDEQADISTIAASFFADDTEQSLPYNPFLRKVPSCGRLVTLTADGTCGTGSGGEEYEESPILRRSASARRARPFESPQHSPTPTRVTRASQKGRGTVKSKTQGARNRGATGGSGSGYLDVKPSGSREVLDPDVYLTRNFSTANKGIVNRGDSFRRRRSRSNSIQPPLDLQNPLQYPQTHTPPATTPTDSNAASPQQILTPGAGSPEPVQQFRVAIIGAQGVGKTALITQFQTSECINAYDVNPTDETEFTLSILLNNLESELVFVNVSSANDFKRETQRAEGCPDAWVILYSITDKASFSKANEDLCKLQSFGLLHGHAIILVANKCELVRSRAVSTDDGRDLAVQYGGKFMEISVGMNHNCDELLVGILNQCRLKEEQGETEEPQAKEKTWTRNRSLMRASMKAKRVMNKIMGKTDTKYKNCEDFDT